MPHGALECAVPWNGGVGMHSPAPCCHHIRVYKTVVHSFISISCPSTKDVLVVSLQQMLATHLWVCHLLEKYLVTPSRLASRVLAHIYTSHICASLFP